MRTLSRLSLAVMMLGIAGASAQTNCQAIGDVALACNAPLTITMGHALGIDSAGTTSPTSPPKCPDGYMMLTYPGTVTMVCGRDLRSPEQ